MSRSARMNAAIQAVDAAYLAAKGYNQAEIAAIQARGVAVHPVISSRAQVLVWEAGEWTDRTSGR